MRHLIIYFIWKAKWPDIRLEIDSWTVENGVGGGLGPRRTIRKPGLRRSKEDKCEWTYQKTQNMKVFASHGDTQQTVSTTQKM